MQAKGWTNLKQKIYNIEKNELPVVQSSSRMLRLIAKGMRGHSGDRNILSLVLIGSYMEVYSY